jgi:hypothetical protein
VTCGVAVTFKNLDWAGEAPGPSRNAGVWFDAPASCATSATTRVGVRWQLADGIERTRCRDAPGEIEIETWQMSCPRPIDMNSPFVEQRYSGKSLDGQRTLQHRLRYPGTRGVGLAQWRQSSQSDSSVPPTSSLHATSPDWRPSRNRGLIWVG